MKITKKCITCGKTFTTYPSHNCKYCSRECRKNEIIRKCLTCNKILITCPSQNHKYCSRKCYVVSQKGKKHPWVKGHPKGYKHSEETKQKIGIANDKGDNISYNSIHAWVVRKKGRANSHKCLHCNKQAFEWCNKYHIYKKILNDYIPLCRSCHRIYDYKYNLKPDNKIGNNQFKSK